MVRTRQMAGTRQAAGTSIGGRSAESRPQDGANSSQVINGQGESSPPRKRQRKEGTDSQSASDQNSGAQGQKPEGNGDLTISKMVTVSELLRIQQEARDEAIKETEAKYKRKVDEAIKETEAKYKKKVQETFQCVVCLNVPKEGHITQCQNGHFLCNACSGKNKWNPCPNCRAPLDKLEGNKRIRALAAEQLIDSMDLTFPCKHLNCEYSAPKSEVTIHEKKCKYRMVPCPDNCCQKKWPLTDLLDHMKLGKEAYHVKITDAGYVYQRHLLTKDWDTLNVWWKCQVLKYQNQLFATSSQRVDGTFYTFVYILGDLEEAKKFKVAIAVGQGTQSGMIHTGQIFPIDAKLNDIIKEKSGVLSFSSVGMGETLFENIKVAGEDKKQLQVHFKIMSVQELNGDNTCSFGQHFISTSFYF